jgi:predicted ester cyclase
MSNIEVVRAYVAAFNAGEWNVLRNLFAPDALTGAGLEREEVEHAAPIWRELRGWTGLHLTVEALMVDGDTVAARFTEVGRFDAPFGELAGASPAPSYVVTTLEWFEFVDGKIARRWGARDFASIARRAEA